MRHGTAGLNRVAFQLAQRDARSHALAIEWLDVTLSGSDRPVVSLLEPNLSDRERLGRLLRSFPVETLGPRRCCRDRAGRRLEVATVDQGLRHPGRVRSGTDELDALAIAGELSMPAAGAESAVLRETIARLRDRFLDLV